MSTDWFRNQSLRPNVNSPDQPAQGGASYGADNQLALPKLNWSNTMTLSSKKPFFFLSFFLPDMVKLQEVEDSWLEAAHMPAVLSA